jgi:glutaredoxin
MKKFIGALARHERAQQEVKRLKGAIGDAVSKCPIDLLASQESDMFDEELFDNRGRTKNHLWRAFREVTDDGFFSPRSLNSGEITYYLKDAETGCPHCLEAWRLIQQRKVARQELGIAKRALRTLGKSAIKMVQP